MNVVCYSFSGRTAWTSEVCKTIWRGVWRSAWEPFQRRLCLEPSSYRLLWWMLIPNGCPFGIFTSLKVPILFLNLFSKKQILMLQQKYCKPNIKKLHRVASHPKNCRWHLIFNNFVNLGISERIIVPLLKRSSIVYQPHHEARKHCLVSCNSFSFRLVYHHAELYCFILSVCCFCWTPDEINRNGPTV